VATPVLTRYEAKEEAAWSFVANLANLLICIAGVVSSWSAYVWMHPRYSAPQSAHPSRFAGLNATSNAKKRVATLLIRSSILIGFVVYSTSACQTLDAYTQDAANRVTH